MKRKVVILQDSQHGQIDAALLPGSIAEAAYPPPPRDADWPASDTFMVERLEFERRITNDLLRLYPAAGSGQSWMREDEARAFLNRHKFDLEVRDDEQRTAETDTTGLVAWQAVLLENWPKIAEYQNKPPGREVMKWLRDNGPRDTFPADSQPVRDSLYWIDGYGGAHTLTISRLRTVLSEWRKAGKIPA